MTSAISRVPWAGIISLTWSGNCVCQASKATILYTTLPIHKIIFLPVVLTLNSRDLVEDSRTKSFGKKGNIRVFDWILLQIQRKKQGPLLID